MILKSLIDLEIQENTIYFIDIDGVMCNSYHYNVDMALSEEKWLKYKESTNLDPNSVLFIKKIAKMNIEFYFLTGRNISSKLITEDMFHRSGLGLYINRIIYNESKFTEKYERSSFIEHKISNIINVFKTTNKNIIIIDDVIQLIDIVNFMNYESIKAIHFSLPYILPSD